MVGVLQGTLKPLLLPLSWGYGCAVGFRNLLFDGGIFAEHVFPRRVVSIGGITAGGSGKTSVVIWLANILKQYGRVCVVTGNYRGKNHGVSVVSMLGRILKFPPEVMDESVVIALKSGCDVVAAKDKLDGVCVANAMGYDYILVDDALHRRDIYRDVNVCVVDCACPLGNGLYIPAGYLRDSVSSLNRCDFVICVDRDGGTHKRLDCLKARYRVSGIMDGRGQTVECKDVFAFCGIGAPAGFIRILGEMGLNVKGEFIFEDHHPYAAEDVEELLRVKEKIGAECLLTTLKDWVKIRRNEVCYLDVDLEVETEEELLESVV